ncbi:hypothetical protein HHL11_15120 [Ramlibacter sp. G-1-2-2]|uniref:HTH luxR-type domain-containing protein n=1 Tax=Ramlibacter agri TaxID=2728837 RepID=A0A848HBZ3_9BURK|nr:LuxR C-terminal-related transcriptional regulator [Ramlibacter agri]NML45088.1 hypothetical protein [Ramlibacter agri]
MDLSDPPLQSVLEGQPAFNPHYLSHQLLDRLQQPALLLTLRGEVQHANRAAHDLRQHTALLQRADGSLGLPAPAWTPLLARCDRLALAHAASGTHFESLRVEAGTESLQAVYGLLGAPVLDPQPLLLVLLYHPRSAPGIDPALLRAMFKLTPTEARIAVLLAEGLTLKEIAAAVQSQPDTVRKHLRCVFGKTGTGRQLDLVRLLLHLPRA